MPPETHASICRFCHANCGILVDVDQGRPVRVTGDPENPAYFGFTCAKGRRLPEQHAHPERLLHSQRRNETGEYEAISSQRAMDEVAERVSELVRRYGPRSVALYAGTAAYQNAAGLPVARAWMAGLGSPSYYTSLTIDQPSKLVAPQHHGSFMSGTHSFDSSDVWMVFGCNSLVSMYGGISGFPSFNPTKRIREARARGLDLAAIGV
jgi:anaerobic selenocysteine-containing dehydrogenase